MLNNNNNNNNNISKVAKEGADEVVNNVAKQQGCWQCWQLLAEQQGCSRCWQLLVLLVVGYQLFEMQ